MKAAILDLGTNVYNLLIADINKNNCSIKKVFKVPSYTGAGGFINAVIDDNAAANSLAALDRIKKEIEQEGGVEIIKAFATSAFRDSSNGREFAGVIRAETGIDVEIIDGEREAELVCKGVRESVLIYNEKILICDIGGGSVELIITGKSDIHWLKSFNLGVVRLKEMFNRKDPIGHDELARLDEYLERELLPLSKACREHGPQVMIGTSGSFDTLREMLCTEDDGQLPAMEIEIEKLAALHSGLLVSTHGERMKMRGISPLRVDYIVTGTILISKILQMCNIKGLWQSSWSLKEGCMAELAESLE